MTYNTAPLYLYKTHPGSEFDIVHSELISGSYDQDVMLISDRLSSSLPEGIRHNIDRHAQHVKVLLRFPMEGRKPQCVFVIVEKRGKKKNPKSCYEIFQVSNTDKWHEISRLPEPSQDLIVSSLVLDAASSAELFLVDLISVPSKYLDVLDQECSSRFLIHLKQKSLSLDDYTSKQLPSSLKEKLKNTFCSYNAFSNIQGVMRGKRSSDSLLPGKLHISSAVDIPGWNPLYTSTSDHDSAGSSGRGSLSRERKPVWPQRLRANSGDPDTTSLSGYCSSIGSDRHLSGSGDFHSSRASVASSDCSSVRVATGFDNQSAVLGSRIVPPEMALSGDSGTVHTTFSVMAPPLYGSAQNIGCAVSLLDVRRQSNSEMIDGFCKEQVEVTRDEYVDMKAGTASFEIPPGCLDHTVDMHSKTMAPHSKGAAYKDFENKQCRTDLRVYLPKIIHRHVRRMSEEEFDRCLEHISSIMKVMCRRGVMPRAYTSRMFASLQHLDDWDHPVHVAAFESLSFVLRLGSGWGCVNPGYASVVVDVATYMSSISQDYWLYPYQGSTELHSRFDSVRRALEKFNTPVEDTVYSAVIRPDEAVDEFKKLCRSISRILGEYFMDVFCRQIEHYSQYPPSVAKLQSYGLSSEEDMYDSTAGDIHHIAKVIGLLSQGMVDAFDEGMPPPIYKVLIGLIRKGESFLVDANCVFSAGELSCALSKIQSEAGSSTKFKACVKQVLIEAQHYSVKHYSTVDYTGNCFKKSDTVDALHNVMKFLGDRFISISRGG